MKIVEKSAQADGLAAAQSKRSLRQQRPQLSTDSTVDDQSMLTPVSATRTESGESALDPEKVD